MDEKSIQETTHKSHTGLASLEHEDPANGKTHNSIADVDELCVVDVNELSQEKNVVDNGGDSQTKSITAQQPGCETADVVVSDRPRKPAERLP